jgi:hypothetical protein
MIPAAGAGAGAGEGAGAGTGAGAGRSATGDGGVGRGALATGGGGFSRLGLGLGFGALALGISGRGAGALVAALVEPPSGASLNTVCGATCCCASARSRASDESVELAAFVAARSRQPASVAIVASATSHRAGRRTRNERARDMAFSRRTIGRRACSYPWRARVCLGSGAAGRPSYTRERPHPTLTPACDRATDPGKSSVWGSSASRRARTHAATTSMADGSATRSYSRTSRLSTGHARKRAIQRS